VPQGAWVAGRDEKTGVPVGQDLGVGRLGVAEHPYFFQGVLLRPKQVADLLRGLMEVVHSRFHIPAAMLRRILTLADPVVTSSEGGLRFEGFSACCGVYARLDLLPSATRGEVLERGTTNVDFNAPMLAALTQLRDGDHAELFVGADEVRLEHGEQSIVERKVRLPLRWIKGFVEVQAFLSRMELVHEVSAAEANRFLRSMPRMSTRRNAVWIVPNRTGLRISQQKSPDGVSVAALERLRALEPLVHYAQRLRIYRDSKTGANAWELVHEDFRFHLALSPEVWRGFSGEGQVLEALSSSDWHDLLGRVRAQLKWNAVIEIDELVSKTGADTATVTQALAALGSRGLVGYDVAERAYFHRELPFDLTQVEKLQPRLLNARKLIDAGRVRVGNRSQDEVEVLVRGNEVEHRVRITAEDAKCTCPWYAKHRGERGPCKHVLAAQMVLEIEE
jgi:hypothetical protein